MARFSVWNGTTINPQYRSLSDIAEAVRELKPEGSWSVEWLVKAGEGGTWQAAWDRHPLALDGMGKLIDLYRQGQRMRPRLRVTPYVVIRGRPEWNDAEWQQIAEASFVGNRVVLNLESGSSYWNGPASAQELLEQYIQPMAERVRAVAPRARIELCAIPRQWVVNQLGGVPALQTWLRHVYSASWECYDALARDLDVAQSMERVLAWTADDRRLRASRFRVPVVQRSRISAWAGTEHSRPGLAVWHLDGDV